MAVVALPLSMAIAVAAGVGPERGLYTAIVAGFLISALGGSRFQIGGPAGAFIVLVAATGARHGLDGLLLATMMAGVFLLAGGFLRLGTYIKFIPHPVTVGFTAGIAVIIFASQMKEFLGLTLSGPEPGAIVPKVAALAAALPTLNPAALGVAAATAAIIVGLRHSLPKWPGMIIAIILTAAATAAFHLPVETIGTRFGAIPRLPPLPSLPDISLAKAAAVLPDAIAFAVLGAIESLLSAVVADGMTGRRHRSNCELVAQGVANIASALFGGICATGTVARTVTNVRAGAHGPVAGILHALFLVALMALAAPLAVHIPLAALAGVLAVVAWDMAERHQFATLLRSSMGDAVVLLATFGLTVFRDLIEAILVGFTIGTLLFLNRMAKALSVEQLTPLVNEDRADSAGGERRAYDTAIATDPDVAVYRISGAFFFGAVSTMTATLDRLGAANRAFVLDLSAVPFIDSSAANAINGVTRQTERLGIRLYISGASPAVSRVLLANEVRPPRVRYAPDINSALSRAKKWIARQSQAPSDGAALTPPPDAGRAS